MRFWVGVLGAVGAAIVLVGFVMMCVQAIRRRWRGVAIAALVFVAGVVLLTIQCNVLQPAVQ